MLSTKPLSHSDTFAPLLDSATAVMRGPTQRNNHSHDMCPAENSYLKILFLNRLSYDFALFIKINSATCVIFPVVFCTV